MKRKIKIGFDLDGVLVNKPPLVPRSLIEWLFKGGQKGLHYRYPDCRAEQLVRKLSHFYLFRPPIKKNIAFLKKIAQDKRFEVYLVSSRYSFLGRVTNIWLKKRKINRIFKRKFFNSGNKQPPVFKEEMIKRLKLDYYYEDDPAIIDYLRLRMKKTAFILVGRKGCRLPEILDKR